MTFKDFQEKWNKVPCKRDAFLALSINHPLDLQIGYGVHGYKSLVIMNSGEIRDVPSSQVIDVDNPDISDGSRRLEFQLKDTKYEDMFLHLCWDMIQCSNDANAMSKLLQRYRRWQRLLQKKIGGEMSFESRKGLLGELLYLEEVIVNRDAAVAIHAWQGPDGGDQDFIFDDSWTEVKSVALAAKDVGISSLEQLNQQQDGILWVYFLEKTTAGSYRHNLVKQIKKIRQYLNGQDELEDSFEMKLYKYGYREKDAEKYADECFRLVECRVYYVGKDFPRLTRENVPSAISECAYKLSLAALDPYRRKYNG